LESEFEELGEQAGRGEAQEPHPGQASAKRKGKSERGSASGSPRRTLLVGLIVAFFLVVFIAAVALAYQVDTFLATDPRFALQADVHGAAGAVGAPIEIAGLQHASRDEVLRVFADDVGLSLYLMPLQARREALKGIDWVEDAAVSRIWPNRLRVAIRERTPVAVAAFSGKDRTAPLVTRLADASGALMHMPVQASIDLPVVFGLEPSQSREACRKQVELLLQLQREVEPLNARFSELHVGDPRNLRGTLVMDGRSLTLILGDRNFLARVRSFITNYEVVVKEEPGANLFDMRLDDRILAMREGLSGA
jgi:cell division protein FtsQ